MIDVDRDEQILAQFRRWLAETREAAAALDDSELAEAPTPGLGLERLVEEFTALRHELKLQTRSARTLEEQVEASLTTLAEAAATYRTAAAATTAVSSAATDKAFATTLADLDEALERGRGQWEKARARLVAPAASAVTALEQLYAAQSWWQRRLTAAYQQRARRALEQAEAQAQSDRQALLDALLAGYALIQKRLAQTMSNAGVARLNAVGRIVDPEQMIVIEVVDAPGPEGQVVEEIRRGYLWHGKLLRPAEVRAIQVGNRE